MTGLTRRQVLDAMRSCLGAEGFRRVGRYDIYLLDLDVEAKGWLSLSADVEGGVVEVSPKVGVRHERLHDAVDMLQGGTRGTEPTVSELLGYLMPQRSANLVWRFERPDLVEDQARNLTAAILIFGRPFMVAHASLEELVQSLRNAVPWEYSQVRIPVGLTLLGRRAEADEFVEEELAKIESRTDAAAEAFRAFARRFELTDAL